MRIRKKIKKHAGMAELVDALDSKSSEGNLMRVQVSLPVPQLIESPFSIYTCQNIFFRLNCVGILIANTELKRSAIPQRGMSTLQRGKEE
jgi:hypothetical protein